MAEEDVYCTLLLNDNYLPGAQVLSHSLRDAGTTKKLAVMVTLSGVKPATVTELKRLYDYVIPVDPIFNETPANLDLMDRLDLNAAFTKINVWKQTQFRRIVFVDADIVALRAPDELFDIDTEFAAAPDVGWPDCFNSGVMLLKPDAGTYFSLLQLAGRGVSFDGADQGLFNSYFRNYHRISFLYNCTPSASYQYVPAFRHYGSQISLAHFIGADKPWTIGRSSPSQQTGSPYDQLLGQWWAVWDKHFRSVLEDSKSGNGTQHGAGGGGSGGGGGGGNSNGFQQVYSGAPHIQGAQQEETGKHPESASHSSGFQQQQRNVQPFQQQQQQQHNVQSFHQTVQQQQHYVQQVQQPVQKPVQQPVQQHRPVPTFQKQQRPVQPEPMVPKTHVATRVWPGETDYQHGASFSPRNESRYTAITPKSKFIPIRSITSPQVQQKVEPPRVSAQPQPLARPFYGAFPESVLTPEGPVPQAQYFETGPQSFLVQKYNAKGEPVSERAQHNYDGRLAETQPGQVVYSAHKWDPAKSSPPTRTEPEARHLPFMMYTNEWDRQPEQSKMTMVSAPTPPPVERVRHRIPVKIQEPVKEPEMKPIFPWEKKPRQTSRVFADEIPVLDDDDDYEGSQATEDILEDTNRDTEEWRDYTRENQWDSVRGIQEYVSGLKHHQTHTFQSVEPNPRILGNVAILDERPPLPVTPAPIRRTGPHWLSAEEGKFPSAAGIPSQEDWDPHAKLEELRGLPPAFIANILAKGTSTNGTQTDNGNTIDINRTETKKLVEQPVEQPEEKPEEKPEEESEENFEEKPEEKSEEKVIIERQPTPVIYNTQTAQTESPQMKDNSTQWEHEDWDEETVAPSTTAPSTTSSQPQTPIREVSVMKLQPVPAPVAKKGNGGKSKEILQETVLNKSPESKVAFVLHREKAQNKGSGDADMGISAKGKADT